MSYSNSKNRYSSRARGRRILHPTPKEQDEEFTAVENRWTRRRFRVDALADRVETDSQPPKLTGSNRRCSYEASSGPRQADGHLVREVKEAFLQEKLTLEITTTGPSLGTLFLRQMLRIMPTTLPVSSDAHPRASFCYPLALKIQWKKMSLRAPWRLTRSR